MNKYSEQFKVWLGKIKSVKYSYKKRGIKPTRDWNILFVTSFIMTIFIASYAVYFYSQVNNGGIFQVEMVEEVGEVKVNRPLLDTVIKEIDTKTIRFVELESRGVNAADPGV